MLVIDLDGFKQVNDTLGHDQRRHLLREVGKRFAAALRETDTVARLGGDEFAILLDGASRPGGGGNCGLEDPAGLRAGIRDQ